MSIDEEAFSIGRMVAKRKDVLEKAKELARRTGRRKVSDVIKESLELYEKLTTIENIDLHTFIKVSTIYRIMMLDAIDMLANMFALFNTDVGKRILKTLLTTSIEERVEEPAEAEAEERRETEPAVSTVIDETRKELVKTMMDMLKMLLSSLLTIYPRIPMQTTQTDISDVKIIEEK